MTAPVAQGRVLATLNGDGSRRWIRPKPSFGGFWQARRVVAYALIVMYLAIPHVTMNGRPLMLLDIVRREFTLFGTTFLPTDTLLLMLLGLSILVAIFLMTALFGRVWCGWGCPQTVWMEFVFRPLERVLEGGFAKSRIMDSKKQHFHPRRLVKYAIYAVIATVLANTFIAYFVGTVALQRWMTQSPFEHPAPFIVMAVTTLMVFLDFTWFREQTCLVACPYGRWQSVLLDKQSLIVAYDPNRGEPRGMPKKNLTAEPRGDCVDCGACVATCPTGIDIRDGLQMECIHCTQCADACDTVMLKVGKPKGLIRYTSKEALAGHVRHILRPRTILYPLAFVLFFGGFVYALNTKPKADVTLLGAIGLPFTTEADGSVVNQLRIKIANRSSRPRKYSVQLTDAPDAKVIAPELPLAVDYARSSGTTLFIIVPAESFHDGRRVIHLRIEDGAGFSDTFQWTLRGPESHEKSKGEEHK